MRSFILLGLATLGLATLGLASCVSPYGTDFSKPTAHASSTTTGSRLAGGASGSNVQSVDGASLGNVGGLYGPNKGGGSTSLPSNTQ